MSFGAESQRPGPRRRSRVGTSPCALKGAEQELALRGWRTRVGASRCWVERAEQELVLRGQRTGVASSRRVVGVGRQELGLRGRRTGVASSRCVVGCAEPELVLRRGPAKKRGGSVAGRSAQRPNQALHLTRPCDLFRTALCASRLRVGCAAGQVSCVVRRRESAAGAATALKSWNFAVRAEGRGARVGASRMAHQGWCIAVLG